MKANVGIIDRLRKRWPYSFTDSSIYENGILLLTEEGQNLIRMNLSCNC